MNDECWSLSTTPWTQLTSVRLMVFILSRGKSLSFGQGGMGESIGGYECTCVLKNAEWMLLVPLHDSLPLIDQRKTHGVYPKRGKVSFLWSGGNGGKGRGAWMYMCAWIEYNCVWWVYACVLKNAEWMLLVPLHDSLPLIDQRKTHGVYPKRGKVSFLWSGGNGGKGRGAWMYMCAWIEYNCVWWVYAT